MHTTQFEIRKPGIDLLEVILRLSAEEIDANAVHPFIKVAGIVGPTAARLKKQNSCEVWLPLGIGKSGRT